MRILPISITKVDSLDELRTKLIEAINETIDTINLPDNAPINARGYRVNNVANPSAPGDAINLGYLDKEVHRISTLERRVGILENGSGSTTPTPTSDTIFPIRSETSNYTFDAADFTVMMNCTGGNRSVFLEPTPANGQMVVVKNLVGLNTLTIDGNGNTIDGAGTLSTTAAGARFMLQYFAATTDWKIIT